MFSFTCGRCASASSNADRPHLSNLVTSANTPTKSSRVALMLARSLSRSFRSSSARLQCCEQVAICTFCARRADALCVCVERLAHLTPARYSPRRAKSRLAAASIYGMAFFSEICRLCPVLFVSQVFLVLQERSANLAWSCHQCRCVSCRCVRLPFTRTLTVHISFFTQPGMRRCQSLIGRVLSCQNFPRVVVNGYRSRTWTAWTQETSNC